MCLYQTTRCVPPATAVPVRQTVTMLMQTTADKSAESSFREANVFTAGLIVTYACNLNCTYCYEHNKKDVYMTLDTAKEILMPLLQQTGDPLEIMLMGGEPLMAFPMICELVEWVDANNERWHRRYHFFGSSNGTLLNARMKEWFSGHRSQITLALSFDGLPDAQNQNRNMSAGRIDLDFFRKQWPEQKIQMTVSEHSVADLASGVIFLLEKGFRVNVSVAYEAHTWAEHSIQVYGEQLLELMKYYLEHPKLEPIYQFEHPLTDYAKELDAPTQQYQQCGAGCGFIMYDVDKKSYPCHMLSPLVLSPQQAATAQTLDMQSADFADPCCQGCPYISACSTCAGCNLVYRGNLARRDETHCKIQQLEVLICMRYKTNLMQYCPDAVDCETYSAIQKLTRYLRSH